MRELGIQASGNALPLRAADTVTLKRRSIDRHEVTGYFG